MAERSNVVGAGCMVLFGGVFLIAGLGIGGLAFKMLWDWHQARGWVAVPAVVETAELEVHRDSDGGTTYQATARYRYRYQGQAFTGERVSTSAGADNIGSFHEDTYARLARHRDSGEPVTAWVNPGDPSEALLVRDMRWGLFAFMMLFPALFGGVGALVVGGSLWSLRSKRRESARARAHPEEPWRWKQRWTSPELRCRNSLLMGFAIGFAVLWNLISSPLLLLLPEEVLVKGNYAALLGLAFPVVGAGLAAWAIYLVIRWRKFGRSLFVLDALPVALGGALEGTLKCPTGIDARELEVAVRCERKTTTGSGKSRSTRTTVLWQDEFTVSLASQGGAAGAKVPIRCPLPVDLPESDETDSRNTVGWMLTAAAEVPGVDFRAEFELPVFRSAASPSPSDGKAFTSTSAEADDPGDWRATGIAHGLVAGGERYYLAPARHPAAAAVVSLFAIGPAIGAYFLAAETWIGAAFLSLFAAVFGLLALSLWLHRSELVVTRGRIRHREGVLPGDFDELSADAVKRLYLKRCGSTGNTVHYDLWADRWGGEPVRLLHKLSGRRDIVALSERLRETAGIRES